MLLPLMQPWTPMVLVKELLTVMVDPPLPQDRLSTMTGKAGLEGGSMEGEVKASSHL